MLNIEKILGRPESPLSIDAAVDSLRGKTILLTGADGSIGTAVANMLPNDSDVILTDINNLHMRHMNITDARQVVSTFERHQPEIIIHLAGAKHAGSGEENVRSTVDINVNGSMNIIDLANKHNASVVLASTCKAVEPETVYGATKLIAERYALNNGHAVARFFNVVETSGNVFEIWAKSGPPYTVANSERYFISLQEAAALVVNVAAIGYGRWTVDPGERINMLKLATSMFSASDIVDIPRRRGDRYAEPLCGMHESIKQYAGRLLKISNPHDDQY